MSGSSVVPSSRNPSLEIRRSSNCSSVNAAQSAASISRTVSLGEALARLRTSTTLLDSCPYGKEKANGSEELLRRAEAPQCLQGRGALCRRGVAAHPSRDAGLSFFRDSELGRAPCRVAANSRFSGGADSILGV